MVATRSANKASARNSPTPPSPTTPSPAGYANGNATGYANGHVKGHANGDANGHAVVAKATPGRKRKSTTRQQSGTYAHVIDPFTILWLFVSLVLVTWDTCYIFLRPWSMPGGWAHSPVWTPYALYGTVDYIYGWPAWNDGVGFTAAQASLNVAESSMYLYYLYKLLQCGAGTNWYMVWDGGYWKRRTVVQGEGMAMAIVVCFSAAVMTVSKTVLYWLNEYFSSYQNIGHNDWSRLVLLWIIPNGAWIVVPSYIIYALGGEIISGMENAGGSVLVKDD